MLRLPMLALTALTVTIAAAHLWLGDALPGEATATARTPSVPSLDPLAAADVQRRIESRKEFATFADSVLDEITAGRLGLRAARDRVLYYCLAHYPEYLSHVQAVETGNDLNEKLARCLVRLVRSAPAAAPCGEGSVVLMDQLDAEFDEMLGDAPADPAPCAS